MSSPFAESRIVQRFAGRGYFSYAGLGIAGLLLVVVLVPIGMMITTSFRSGPIGSPGHLTASNYHTVLADPTAAHLLTNTLIYALGSALLAMALASLFAWTVTRVPVPAKRILTVLPLLTIVAPGLLKDIAWIELYSPNTGLANLGLEHLLHVHGPIFNIYSMWGLIIVTAVYVVPVPYLILLQPFESLDPSLEEASLVAGVSRMRTHLLINARVLMPAILSAFALTLIVVAGTFEAPLLIGLPGGITTYMSAIYRSLTSEVPNFTLASAQAAWYLSLTLLIFWVYLRVTRREQRFVTVTGRASRKPAHVATPIRIVLVGFLLLEFVIAFVLPIGLAALTLFVPIYKLQAGNLHGAWNLDIIRSVLSRPIDKRGIVGSLELASLVSVLSVALGAALSFIAFKTRVKGRRVAELIGMLPVAMPGMVIAVTMLVTFLAIVPLRPFYNTLVPMIVVSIIVSLPFTVRIFSSALIQIDSDILRASALSGANAIRTMIFVLAPLLRRAGLNALIISFMVTFRELGAIILLVPANHSFVSPLAWIYWNTGDYNGAAVLNAATVVAPLCMAGVVIAVVWLIRLLLARVRRSSLLNGVSFGGRPAFASRRVR